MSNDVSVIDTASNTVTATITVAEGPSGVAVTPDGSKVFVANLNSNNVSVIDTASNTVTATIPVGTTPVNVAVTPDGSKVYVSNEASSVSVIDTASNTVTAASNTVTTTIPVGMSPIGVAVTPDGSKVYVANENSNTVSVITSASNTVIGSPIPVGVGPSAFGLFIQPARKFAGTPGRANCHGQSVRALGQKFDGLDAAATALGYCTVSELQNAITTFCEG